MISCDEIVAGLQRHPKTLPPKLLYDERGSQLFEAITQLDEYYLTRAEVEILETYANAMAEHVGAESVILELGSGNSRKIRVLMDALRAQDALPVAYVPIDVASTALMDIACTMSQAYPGLTVTPVVADFMEPDAWSAISATLDYLPGRRVAFFPGSTIGNLHPPEAEHLLRQIHDLCGAEGALLLGADLRKDPAVLHAAYNDARGITAAFNRNMLTHVNHLCSANFDVDTFRHYAFYNPVAGRIEMHLVSMEDQQVRVADTIIAFARGESIWTESSYKYDGPSMEGILTSGGWMVQAYWQDAARQFGVWYCIPREATHGH